MSVAILRGRFAQSAFSLAAATRLPAAQAVRKLATGGVAIEVDDDNFAEKVLKESKPVIVDFYANWCRPCRDLAPKLERLVGETKGAVILAKIDVDNSPNTAAKYDISSIPAVFAFHKGKPVSGFVGNQDETNLKTFVSQVQSVA
eukprot:Colp12_sorted_trinity150504_noHs@11614